MDHARMSVDLDNRDPNSINSHLQVAFEDVLAEPDGVHSIDCVWRVSYECFNCWRNCSYKFSSLMCGLCIAAQLGCQFAQISFCHVWWHTPCLKSLEINCVYLRRLWATCVGCCVEPLCTAVGMVFHQFNNR